MTGSFAPHDGVQRLCVRVPNWVGDVVMATPALRALRAHFADAHLTIVVRERVEAVLRRSQWFDDSIIYRPAGDGATADFLRCVGLLRGGRYELGLVLPNSFSSALMFRLAGIRRRVGYARDWRSFLLTDAVPRPSQDGRFKPTYMVDYYLALCGRLGIGDQGRDTELPFDEADVARAEAILSSTGVAPGEDLFLLHPGAGYGPSKRWPEARFAELAEMLVEEYGGHVALIGGPGEQHIVKAIVAGSAAPIIDLSNRGVDLHLLKCVVARSKLLVTTDSGPRHYGVALRVPTVCVMGPTHPGYSTSPRAHDHVVRLDVECGPCQRKVCPLDHRCMEEITAQMVFDACRRALESGGGA